VDGVERKLKPFSRPGPGSHALERAIYGEVERTGGDVKELHKRNGNLTDSLRSRLLEEGLICTDDTSVLVRWSSFLPFAPVLLLGCLKLTVGLQRHRPVVFLFVLCVLTVLMMLCFDEERPHRTRRGDRLLSRLARENAALHETALTAQGSGGLKPRDVALAVGLFGGAMLAAGPLSDLGLLIKPPGAGSVCGSGGGGCGGGGCGGGGCGGGCGGCGGGCGG
jgi:uncharacterized protein (TIGR04222 family)